MKLSNLALLFLFCALPAPAAERLYRFSIDQDKLSGAPDFSRLNRALTPADQILVRGGHFSRLGKDLKPNTADDSPIRFFGTNLCFAGNFPDPADAPRIAKRMRRLGINLVRLHHTDTSPDREESRAGSLLTQEPYPTLNPTSVARLRILLDAFKAEGIYINLNLHIGYEFRPEIDRVPPLPNADRLPTHSKPLHIFYPRMVELQTQYAERVINALKLRNDPVLAMVEIDNETSLSHAWQTGQIDTLVTGEYRAELERQWKVYAAKTGDAGPLVSPKDNLPAEQVNRFLMFLIDRDRQYLAAMRDAVRRAAGTLVPIAGTQMDFGGLLNLDSHDVLDYGDAHFYIDHYNFPHQRWDSRDWRIRDSSSVGTGLTTFLNEAASRQAGRPYTLSEYNQAFPNSYGNEIDATLAAFASFQDWDGLMHFAYAHGRNWDDQTPSGFNLASDTAKLPLFGQSAWLFRTAAVRPGQPLDIPVSQELRLRAARERMGRQVAPFLQKVGGYQPAVALSRAVRLVKDGVGEIPAVAPASAGEIRYDAAARLFLIQAPKAAGVFGFLGKNKVTAGAIDLELAPETGEFATLMVTALDDKPIAKSKRLLVSVPGKVLRSRAGTEEPLKLVNYPGTTDWWTLPKEDPNQEKPSAPSAGGSGPLWMERMESTLTLRTAAKAIAVYPLDGAGARMKALAAAGVQKAPGGFRIHLQGDGQDLSPWFEIVSR